MSAEACMLLAAAATASSSGNKEEQEQEPEPEQQQQQQQKQQQQQQQQQQQDNVQEQSLVPRTRSEEALPEYLLETQWAIPFSPLWHGQSLGGMLLCKSHVLALASSCCGAREERTPPRVAATATATKAKAKTKTKTTDASTPGTDTTAMTVSATATAKVASDASPIQLSELPRNDDASACDNVPFLALSAEALAEAEDKYNNNRNDNNNNNNNQSKSTNKQTDRQPAAGAEAEDAEAEATSGGGSGGGDCKCSSSPPPPSPPPPPLPFSSSPSYSSSSPPPWLLPSAPEGCKWRISEMPTSTASKLLRVRGDEEAVQYEPVIDDYTDHEGWVYGGSLQRMLQPRLGGRASSRMLDSVRRRRWVRRRGPREQTEETPCRLFAQADDWNRIFTSLKNAISHVVAERRVAGFPLDPVAHALRASEDRRRYQRLCTSLSSWTEAEVLEPLCVASLYARAMYGFVARMGYFDTVAAGAMIFSVQKLYFDLSTQVDGASNRRCFLDAMQLRRQDLLFDSWASDTMCPVVTMVRDHEMQWLVVSIRGTLSFKDILTDMACNTRPFLNGYAHEGFAFAAERLVEVIRSTLKPEARKYPNYRLVLTGHSMGAAISALAAAKLRAEDPWAAGCVAYCFGPPAIFCRTLARDLDASGAAITVVNGNDWVPRTSLTNSSRLFDDLVSRGTWRSFMRQTQRLYTDLVGQSNKNVQDGGQVASSKSTAANQAALHDAVGRLAEENAAESYTAETPNEKERGARGSKGGGGVVAGLQFSDCSTTASSSAIGNSSSSLVQLAATFVKKRGSNTSIADAAGNEGCGDVEEEGEGEEEKQKEQGGTAKRGGGKERGDKKEQEEEWQGEREKELEQHAQERQQLEQVQEQMQEAEPDFVVPGKILQIASGDSGLPQPPPAMLLANCEDYFDSMQMMPDVEAHLPINYSRGLLLALAEAWEKDRRSWSPDWHLRCFLHNNHHLHTGCKECQEEANEAQATQPKDRSKSTAGSSNSNNGNSTNGNSNDKNDGKKAKQQHQEPKTGSALPTSRRESPLAEAKRGLDALRRIAIVEGGGTGCGCGKDLPSWPDPGRELAGSILGHIL